MKAWPLVLLALTAAMVAAQQPSNTGTKSPAVVPANQPAQRDTAAPATSTDRTAPSEDGQFETIPDQNIDPSQTTPPPAEVREQEQAVASMRKAIPAGSLSLAASIGKNILVVRVNGRDVKTYLSRWGSRPTRRRRGTSEFAILSGIPPGIRRRLPGRTTSRQRPPAAPPTR